MKQLAMVLILALFLCMVSSTQAMANYTIKISYDMMGSYHVDDNAASNPQDVKPRFSIGYEYTFTNGANEYGVGMEYQFSREIEGNNGAEFHSIPIYGIYNHYFSDKEIKPYFTGKIGYNFMDGNNQFTQGSPINGGVYFGIGGGIRYGNYIAELVYSGTHCQPSYSREMEYNKLALTFGL